eukprot:TRINITY_DN1123_c0_g2_i1.p1 TRINITY_DN1123_c0_g2~~TRINITY_DN1123_c0_g2_i1.p1  ORF type:complete len:513 (-),score=66.19 TRINITY_DN1123_c0_g2_i1:358-1896(-)
MDAIVLLIHYVENHLKIQNLNYPVLLLIPLLAYLIKHFIKKPRLRIPPGPSSLPVIGNLHQLGNLPHRSLGLLSKKHGPLMYLQLGQIPTVIISSAEMAKEVMKTHDLMFCTRPPLTAMRKFTYGGLDVAAAPYSEHWRQLRKLITLELLSTKRVQSFRPIRVEEIGFFVRTITKFSLSGPVNLSELLLCLLNNITCRIVFGKRFSKEGECGRSKFHELVTETIELLGGFCAGDFFPSMEWLNKITGIEAKLEKNYLEMDAFLAESIKEHRCNKNHEFERNDFLSVLLQLQKDSTLGMPLSDEHIKGILLDMFLAGTDTSSTILEWGLTELMMNPRVLTKAQDEVRRVVGKKEKVEESDLDKLEYLKLVVKEILRFHPPVPLLIPRESREDCKINGYDIMRKTRVYVNVWAIGRDPKLWENPNEFFPERFIDSPIDYKGQEFHYLPFGSGRRGCPGITSGVIVIELALANLLHIFNWDLPQGMTPQDIDTTEAFGIVIHKKSPLLLVPTLQC